MAMLSGGRVEVLSFKQGLLSKVAHDLCLACERSAVESDGASVNAEFSLDSLRVRGVMRDGLLDETTPSDSDRREILDNVRTKILQSDRHPTARFRGSAKRDLAGARVEGELELAGRTAAIAFDVVEAEGRWRGEVELVPTRWGIEPFRALLGAIKLQDRVIVRFDFPVTAL